MEPLLVQAPGQITCPMCPGGGMGMMWFSGIVWTLLGIALIVLVIVAIVRLWPRGPATFQSSLPPERTGKGDEGDSR